MDRTPEGYDFSVCKVCGNREGFPRYHLKRVTVYVCPACGFHYTNILDPYPSDFGLKRDSLTEEAADYIENQLQSDEERFDRHVRWLQRQGELRGKKVLDIGCGGGLFLSKVRDLGAEAHGIELSDARAQYAAATLGLDVVKYPVEHDHWQGQYSEYFDIVTLWDVIEHVNFPLDTLKAAARLIKPNGFLFLDTPFRGAFYHRFGAASYRLSAGRFPTFLNVMYSSQASGHKQILTSEELFRFLHEAGLDIADHRRIHELSFPYSFYLRKLLGSEKLVRVFLPIVSGFFRFFRIRNKIIAVGFKGSADSG